MHLELLVEEPSAEAALVNLLPKMLTAEDRFMVHPHQGKSDLLAKLPGRLRGYRHWITSDYRIVVLIDRDQQDCLALKQTLEEASRSAQLWTRGTAPAGQPFQVINRLAVEELEAWFFGDIPALVAAYPGVSPTLARQARYRDPDNVRGGTWEALERVLQRAGYFPGGLPKIEVARTVSQHMDPARNRSKSFQVFRDSILSLIATPKDTPPSEQQ
jgi:Domain of unknown function (DUF4276)